MHDTLISADIIGAAEQKGVVKSITVEVGDLGHVPADELRQTLERLKPDWKINTVRRHAKAKCTCGYEGEPEILEKEHGMTWYCCPQCKAKPEVIEGEDMILKDVLTK